MASLLSALEPIRLVLVDLPADAETVNLGNLGALGSRAAVAARLMELLPGATFDESGRGSFQRPRYGIRFTLEGDEPALVAVDVDRVDGLAALARVVAKTGWRAVDPDALAFVDLDASRSAGVTVLIAPSVNAVAPVPSGPTFLSIGRAVGVLVALLAVWGAWQYARNRPDPMTPGAIARTQVMSDAAFRWAVERARRRSQLTKAIAPHFRTNTIVVQLFDFFVASIDYSTGFGMGRFAKPDRLSDAADWERMRIPAPLPPSFAEPRRDGYAFEFLGMRCGPMPNNMSAPQDDCDQFIYVARPIDGPGAPKARPAFALFSEDARIHYRDDGGLPTLESPTVDHISAPENVPAPAGLLTSIGKSVAGVFEWIAGPSKPNAVSIAAAEASAIQDLRAVAAAEHVFSIMMNGDRYTSPEVLADPKMFAPARMPPLLPGYFVQPIRMGYAFEFSGRSLTVPFGAFDWISPNYGSFVYVARPLGEPAGRRTFALYPDGNVFATHEGRVPTREDMPLGVR